MTRLLHLNGPPGIGKSTLARRYADGHPTTLCCDVDLLRTMVGGWQQDFLGAGALIRPAALAMIEAFLRTGHDVVLPQLLVNLDELARFEACAERAGADFVERVLMDDPRAAIARFHRRGGPGPADAWHDQVRVIVAESGGDDVLVGYHAGLERLLRARPHAVRLTSIDGDPDQTYRALLDSLVG